MKVSNITKPLALMLCAFSIPACATPSQMYWDHKVKELCEKDGGVTLFEKVEIKKSDYSNLRTLRDSDPNRPKALPDTVILPFEKNATSDDPFFIRYKSEYVHKGSPSVTREETSIVRRVDNKVLSKKIMYTRSGGDIEIGSHPSHYSCDKWKRYHETFESTITIKGE